MGGLKVRSGGRQQRRNIEQVKGSPDGHTQGMIIGSTIGRASQDALNEVTDRGPGRCRKGTRDRFQSLLQRVVHVFLLASL